MPAAAFKFRSTYASQCRSYTSLGAKHMYNIRVLVRSKVQRKMQLWRKTVFVFVYLYLLFAEYNTLQTNGLGQCFPTFPGLGHPTEEKCNLQHPVANPSQFAKIHKKYNESPTGLIKGLKLQTTKWTMNPLGQGSGTYGSRAKCGSFDDGIWLASCFLYTIVMDETFSVIFLQSYQQHPEEPEVALTVRSILLKRKFSLSYSPLFKIVDFA